MLGNAGIFKVVFTGIATEFGIVQCHGCVQHRFYSVVVVLEYFTWFFSPSPFFFSSLVYCQASYDLLGLKSMFFGICQKIQRFVGFAGR